MPPRRSARVAAAAELRSVVLAPLPLALVHRVFLLLPVDSRARAACVCRSWRDSLSEAALWTRLDLSGVELEGDALLRGAAGRALGQLCYLDISESRDFSDDVVMEVLTANAGTLRELHLSVYEDEVATLDAVLAAAPRLQLLRVDLNCGYEDAPRVLRLEPLQVRALSVAFSDDGDPPAGLNRVAPVTAALASTPQHAPLTVFEVRGVDARQSAVMDALVDAALVRQVIRFELSHSTPPAAASLARLLRDGKIKYLDCSLAHTDEPLFDVAGAALIADALRATSVLTHLVVFDGRLFRDVHAALAVLRALMGHPSLKFLHLYEEAGLALDDSAAVGAALGALVAANASALKAVHFGHDLPEDGLCALLDALPLNNHLRDLTLRPFAMTEAFARQRLLPAVRANTSLRSLAFGGARPSPAVQEALRLVAHRNPRHVVNQ